jgi:hypothetical protein
MNFRVLESQKLVWYPNLASFMAKNLNEHDVEDKKKL